MSARLEGVRQGPRPSPFLRGSWWGPGGAAGWSGVLWKGRRYLLGLINVDVDEGRAEGGAFGRPGMFRWGRAAEDKPVGRRRGLTRRWWGASGQGLAWACSWGQLGVPALRSSGGAGAEAGANEGSLRWAELFQKQEPKKLCLARGPRGANRSAQSCC